MKINGMDWDVFVKLTCDRLSEEVNEPIVQGVDVLLEMDNGLPRYTALTEKGNRALLIAKAIMDVMEARS